MVSERARLVGGAGFDAAGEVSAGDRFGDSDRFAYWPHDRTGQPPGAQRAQQHGGGGHEFHDPRAGFAQTGDGTGVGIDFLPLQRHQILQRLLKVARRRQEFLVEDCRRFFHPAIRLGLGGSVARRVIQRALFHRQFILGLFFRIGEQRHELIQQDVTLLHRPLRLFLEEDGELGIRAPHDGRRAAYRTEDQGVEVGHEALLGQRIGRHGPGGVRYIVQAPDANCRRDHRHGQHCRETQAEALSDAHIVQEAHARLHFQDSYPGNSNVPSSRYVHHGN
ncbi:conserved hypothetical protein [Ricinus communis]|uniref:Uncharacterized protein n=1 Tax=Ricinus communis TaxID=3988 RepID=B9TEW4_RICCO|nr:conserved hypothetical protein [Ricinus communis]